MNNVSWLLAGFLSLFSATACSVDVPTGDDRGALGSGLSCSVDADCPQGEECEDAVCKLHDGSDDDSANDDSTDDNGVGGDGAGGDGAGGDDGLGAACTLDTDCAGGLECEHGACQPHGGDTSSSASGGGTCSTDADCGGGLECEDGACKPHGGA